MAGPVQAAYAEADEGGPQGSRARAKPRLCGRKAFLFSAFAAWEGGSIQGNVTKCYIPGAFGEPICEFQRCYFRGSVPETLV